MKQQIEYTYELLNKETGEIILANPVEFSGIGADEYVDFITEKGETMRFSNPDGLGQIVDEVPTDGTYVARLRTTHVEADGAGDVHDVIPEGTEYMLVNKQSGQEKPVETMDTFDAYTIVKVAEHSVRFEKVGEGDEATLVNDFFTLKKVVA